MKEGYIDFLLSIYYQWSLDRVVCLGDLFDWHCLSYHEKQPLVNICDEMTEAKKQVQQIAEAFPEADWIIGNHDDLPRRQMVTAGIPPGLLQAYNEFWEIDWTVHPRFSSIEIDGVLYFHGDKGPGGDHAAFKHAQKNFKSVVQGHYHQNAGVDYYANEEFLIFGMGVGCGMDYHKMQFEYGRKFPRKPILGCGVVIDGQEAHFEPWLLGSR